MMLVDGLAIGALDNKLMPMLFCFLGVVCTNLVNQVRPSKRKIGWT